MKKLLIAGITVAMACCSWFVTAAELYPHYVQAPNPNGGLVKSSWWAPNGSDYDESAWDSFVLATPHSISELSWRGGRAIAGFGGPVVDFQVRIYGSLGNQPDIVSGPLADYSTVGNANETPAGVFGGVAMYDYRFRLPTPFSASAGVQYWLQISGAQTNVPDWGVAAGTCGNGTHIHYTPGTHQYVPASGDFAFSVWAPNSEFTVLATASPATGGTASGGGTYPNGSNVTLTASANAGYVFVDWKAGVTQVSTSPIYSFAAANDRDLVATFVPAYTITTTAAPPEGGTTTGGGVYPQGSNITVRAVANPGFRFLNWNQNSVVVSTSSNYLFSVTSSRNLVADFITANTAPRFNPVGLKNVDAGTLLTFVVSATDTDQPPQSLSFSLGAGAPAGASLSTNGVFSWTPPVDQTPGSNSIAMIVTDNGVPALTDTIVVTVVVHPVPEPPRHQQVRGVP